MIPDVSGKNPAPRKSGAHSAMGIPKSNNLLYDDIEVFNGKFRRLI